MTDLSAHPTQLASSWLADFQTVLERRDIAAAVALFAPESYWRDLVAFTWNICTQESPAAIRTMLQARLAEVQPSAFAIEGEATEAGGVVDAWFTFETAVARGRGHLRLKDGKAWTLLTTMTELKGFEEQTGERRIKGAEHGAQPGRKSWLEKRQHEAATLGFDEQPYVLIVGGGQGGIALGARLRRLGVPTIIVEKNEKPGDSWRKRYKSLCLHDPVWYDHLPYLPFPDHWPVFAPKDKIGDWLEMYSKVMELNYWGGTTARKARFDEATQQWEVTVERGGDRDPRCGVGAAASRSGGWRGHRGGPRRALSCAADVKGRSAVEVIVVRVTGPRWLPRRPVVRCSTVMDRSTICRTA